MNKQEAIEVLKERYITCIGIGLDNHANRVNEAINMAIEALYKPTSNDLIIKGAKGIKDGLYNIQNGELFQHKAKGGTVRAYPIVEALQDDWIPLSDDSVVPDYYEVMCQDRRGNMMFGYASIDKYGIWMCEDDSSIMNDVIAWQPRPEPYKEGDTE